MCIYVQGGLFLGSTNPIFLELGAEMTFPVSEGSSAGKSRRELNLINEGVITLFNNIGAVIFLLGAPYIKYDWINSIVTLSLLLCGVMMIFVKEEYLRKNFDNK